MIQHQDEISQVGGRVLLVTYDEPALLGQKMMHDLTNPFPLLLDPGKVAYKNWGLGRTGVFGAMLSPSLNIRYVKLLVQGERFLGFAPDMFQLGGDFVITRESRIAYAHAMSNNGDRANVKRLLEELRKAAGIVPG